MALSNTERQARWRRKAQEALKVAAVTEAAYSSDLRDELAAARAEVARLEGELADARRTIGKLEAQNLARWTRSQRA